MTGEYERRTLTIDARLLAAAREQAARDGISIDALVTEALRLQSQRSRGDDGRGNPERHRRRATGGSYLAFISYSHADQETAAGLHKRLERFRVPRALVGGTTGIGRIPRRIRPIFRDQEEFPASADLGHSIREALRDSRTLIVVCSPRSAASAWVGEEIRYFKQLGGGARIYCLLIDGNPTARNPEGGASAALHSALLEQFDQTGRRVTGEAPEPLAIDVRECGLANATLKIAAGVLDVNYDELFQRVRRARRRRMALSAAVAGAVAIVIGWLFIDGVREKRYNRAQQLSVTAQQQLYDENPKAALALALHAVKIGPPENEPLRKRARELLSRGRIAALGGGIEGIFPSPDGSQLVLDRADASGEIRSGIDGSLHQPLPDRLRDASYHAGGGGHFLLHYERAGAELRHAGSAALVAPLAAPVTAIKFGPRHLFAQNSGGYPSELRRLSDGGLVELGTGARPESVSFGSQQSDLMTVTFYGERAPQLRRQSDEASMALPRPAAKLELSSDDKTSRLLVTGTDGSVELLRTHDLSLVRRFTGKGVPAGFWSKGARLMSTRAVDGVTTLIDLSDGSSVASGLRIRRSRDPQRSLVAVVSAAEAGWYSAASGEKLGAVSGTFTDARFSRDLPPSRIALRHADGWQLHRLEDGALVSRLPGIAELSLDREYLVASRVAGGRTQREIRRLADGALAFAPEAEIDSLKFVGSDLILMVSQSGAQRFHRLPSGQRAKLPSRRNIEFDAPLGPEMAFHMIRYTDGRTELRAGLEGATLAWIAGKIMQPAQITFLPQSQPTHILVDIPDTPSAIYPLTPRARASQQNGADIPATLSSAVARADLLPVADGFYLLLRYANGSAELWRGLNPLRRLVRLQDNLNQFVYSDASRRLVLQYADGSGEIIDLEWLEAANAHDLTDRELFELACRGPLLKVEIDALEPLLQGERWLGCP